ncbi:putative protein N(5)-glutamine methyltransferase [Streptomyces sp. J2-1]|uniref:putative protein N(5)-glutamine methyltransferase n=1 Tax=Streptomyces corallincola TaxID=2851888 RepID=UPI001C388F42|nr:putative protein N(5)-glutamine methyltransferase [Streptomyces corallincola]MBV2352951.1 putative protein N(5)-glutamine methyltransferase [Streptomyces corallincola]
MSSSSESRFSAPVSASTSAARPPSSEAPLTPSAVVSVLRAAGCVFAEDEARLILAAAHDEQDLAAKVARRVAGHPLEQVVGWAEFHGLRISVEPGVFVPRRRTEFLIDQALAHASLAAHSPSAPGTPVVVDLCCGSGALGAALAAELGTAEVHVEVHAADIDPVAVRCARRNLAPYGGHAHEGDLFAALPADLRGRIGILTANVPYVPTREVPLLPTEARDHEPATALDGGADGLDVLRRVAAEAPAWLAPGGCLLSETSERQARAAADAFAAAGLTAHVAVAEEEYAHVVIGVQER